MQTTGTAGGYDFLVVRVSRFVCIFASGENIGFVPSSRREQQSTGQSHLIVRISPLERNNGKFHKELPIIWSECRDSNSRPLEPHSSAIPNFATPGYSVVLSGLEYDSIIRRKNQVLFLKSRKYFSYLLVRVSRFVCIFFHIAKENY